MPIQRWLITGASGQLGSHVVRQLAAAGGDRTLLALAGRHEVGTAGVDVRRVDLADLDALRDAVTAFKPTHVVHLGAMTAVGDCHAHPAQSECINVQATRVLAETVAESRARLVFSSTDMVFGGEAAPYRESDPPRPLSHYGRTKAAAERILADFDHTLVVRIPLMYGFPWARRETTFGKQIADLRGGRSLRLFTDEFRTPVWLADAAQAVIGLARSDVTGVLHVAGPERLSRYGLIAHCAELLGMSQPKLVPISRLDTEAAEPRPGNLSLDGSRFAKLFTDLTPGPLRAAVLGET